MALRVLLLSVLVLPGCFLVAPFDEAAFGRLQQDGIVLDGTEDGGSGLDADADAGAQQQEPEGDGGAGDSVDAEVEAARALCEPYCQAREACAPGDGGALCVAACQCAAGRIVRPDWAEGIQSCAVAADCEVDDPLTECAAARADDGGATEAAQVAYDACVAREGEGSCPDRLDCPLLLAMRDEAAAAAAECFGRPTCDDARDCAEAALLSQCLD